MTPLEAFNHLYALYEQDNESNTSIEAWQTLKAHCIQPTDNQQLKAEIAALVNQLHEHDLQVIGSMKIDLLGILRQLSA
jgi:hypothetical protein